MNTINNFIGKHMMIIALVIGLVGLCGLVYLTNTSGGGRTEFIESARRAVEAQGYTTVQYVDVDLTACDYDHAGFAFDADNVNGVRIRVVACNPEGGTANYRGNWYLVTKGK
jgi:hypothetical protein